MKFITYSGEAVALCLALPNWGESITVQIDLTPVTEVTKALSARRSARRFARTARCNFEYSVLTQDAHQSAQLKLWLQRLKGETVAVPLWTDGVEIYSAVTAGDTVINKTPNNPVLYGKE